MYIRLSYTKHNKLWRNIKYINEMMRNLRTYLYARFQIKSEDYFFIDDDPNEICMELNADSIDAQTVIEGIKQSYICVGWDMIIQEETI